MAKSPTKTAATTAPAAQPAGPVFKYEHRAEVAEIFADTAHRMAFDGRTLRIEFCVNRPGEDDKDGSSVPVCRLVLDLNGAVDVFNKINSLQSALERQGVIRKTPGK